MTKLPTVIFRHVDHIYNHGHNISEVYNVLVKVRFATSKTKLDI